MSGQLYSKLATIMHNFRVNNNISQYIKNLVHITTKIKRRLEMLLNVFCWRCNSVNITVGLYWYRLYTNVRSPIALVHPLQFKILRVIEPTPVATW